jgi:hypothetical protein
MSVLGCPLVVSSSFAGHWLFGDGGCIYSGFVITFCGLSTILILATLAQTEHTVDVNKMPPIALCKIFGIISVSVMLLVK